MIQTSGNIGMQTMDMCLRDLYLRGAISRDMALQRAMNRTDLENMIMQAEIARQATNQNSPQVRRQ